mgnify:CR=1 FL=1
MGERVVHRRIGLAGGVIACASVVAAMIGLANARLAKPSSAARQQFVGWPVIWTSIGTDPDEPGCGDHRNVFRAYAAVDAEYLYLRLQNVSPAGWPNTGPTGEARYKWFFDVNGDGVTSGGNMVDAEYLLMLEDLTVPPDPTLGRDQLGELTLMDDLSNVGFMARWGGGSPPGYTTNAPASTQARATHPRAGVRARCARTRRERGDDDELTPPRGDGSRCARSPGRLPR